MVQFKLYQEFGIYERDADEAKNILNSAVLHWLNTSIGAGYSIYDASGSMWFSRPEIKWRYISRACFPGERADPRLIHTIIEFKDKKSAMMFKLRWL